ncbi:hypothetical protein GWK47_020078 [Chionoecetes opilio]|uniref:Uncharacterized protein n=1 Tax=Chionoecetes opilio TaxID=41210 RepID=A0A8J4XYI0_CHIOP|nr:hypothetical protein GWK47_020078 [Chionoecetes opilio]
MPKCPGRLRLRRTHTGIAAHPHLMRVAWSAGGNSRGPGPQPTQALVRALPRQEGKKGRILKTGSAPVQKPGLLMETAPHPNYGMTPKTKIVAPNRGKEEIFPEDFGKGDEGAHQGKRKREKKPGHGGNGGA